MSNKVKDIITKSCTHYFFDDIINIKDFDSNHIKIEEKSHINILIYCTGYVTVKDSKYVKISKSLIRKSFTPYYQQNELNRYFEEIHKSKYLTLVLTNESNDNKKLKMMKNCGLTPEI